MKIGQMVKTTEHANKVLCEMEGWTPIRGRIVKVHPITLLEYPILHIKTSTGVREINQFWVKRLCWIERIMGRRLENGSD